jgi:hypothetical protein
VEYHYTRIDPNGKTTDFSEEIESRRSGPWRSLHGRSKDSEWVDLAHPRDSFAARRKGPGDAWEIHEVGGDHPERTYRRILSEIGRREPWTGMAAGLLAIAEEVGDRADLSAFTVVELTPYGKDGHRFIRIRLENRTPSGIPWRRCTTVLAADDHFAVRSDEFDLSTGMTLTGQFAYDRHEGRPVLRSIHNSGRKDDGTRTTSGFTVLGRRFEPTPETEFSREHLLAGAPVRTITDPDPFADEPSRLMRWYWLPIAIGAAGLMLGAGLRLGAGRGRGKSVADRTGAASPAPAG